MIVSNEVLKPASMQIMIFMSNYLLTTQLLLATSLSIAGVLKTARAVAAVIAKLPPKYRYVVFTLCFTYSGHILKKPWSRVQQEHTTPNFVLALANETNLHSFLSDSN